MEMCEKAAPVTFRAAMDLNYLTKRSERGLPWPAKDLRFGVISGISWVTLMENMDVGIMTKVDVTTCQNAFQFENFTKKNIDYTNTVIIKMK